MKKTLFIFFFAIALFFVSCEKNELEPKTNPADGYADLLVEHINFDSIPKIVNTINNITSKASLTWYDVSSRKTPRFWIDRTKILRAQDSLGNLSYSLRIHSVAPSTTVLYNLIVTERTDEETIAPFVIAYKFDSGDAHNYSKNKYLNSKANIYSLKEFAMTSGISIKDNKPAACFKDVGENNNNRNSNNSSSGGNSGGSNSPVNGKSTPSVSYGRAHISTNNATRGKTGSVEVGIGRFYMPSRSTKANQKNSVFKDRNNSNVCPKGYVNVPINEITKLNAKAILEALSPDDPIKDLAKFLECYDISKPARVTIYVNQPIKNSSLPVTLDSNREPNPGHAFVSISQNGKTSTFGFYPDSDGIKALAPSVSAIGNNGGDPYDVSISKTVSGSVLSNIISSAINHRETYDLSLYNCTNYARDLGNIAGMNIPNAWGIYPGLGAGGQNPGKLGQVIRNMNSKTDTQTNTIGGNAIQKGTGCK